MKSHGFPSFFCLDRVLAAGCSHNLGNLPAPSSQNPDKAENQKNPSKLTDMGEPGPCPSRKSKSKHVNWYGGPGNIGFWDDDPLNIGSEGCHVRNTNKFIWFCGFPAWAGFQLPDSSQNPAQAEKQQNPSNLTDMEGWVIGFWYDDPLNICSEARHIRNLSPPPPYQLTCLDVISETYAPDPPSHLICLDFVDFLFGQGSGCWVFPERCPSRKRLEIHRIS